jgi:endo-1,4-beta-xylanase
MKKPSAYFFVAALLMLALGCNTGRITKQPTTLKDAYADLFYIGTALNNPQITGQDTVALRVIKQHFNSIVAENIMKSGLIQPQEGQFDFTLADQFVEFGEKNNMHMVGHTLIWHSQAPRWFFSDENGNDVSAEVLTERMRNHIYTVVGRYKGRIHGWDVVNETIEDNGSWRNSKFYQILGEDFVSLAFQLAHEADPDAELYYNDYSMAEPGKRQGVINMVKAIQAKGIPVHGIGMQGHLLMNHPSIEEFEKSIVEFAALGVKVMITELDLSVLPWPSGRVTADVSTNIAYNQELNPYVDGLTDEAYAAWEQRMTDFFRLFIKHSDKISRVTTWGTHDTMSWKNGFPIRGRTDYPLLFDRNLQPKPVVDVLIREASNTTN